MDSITIDLNQAGALTHDSVRRRLASVDDRTNTQLRVTKAGIAFISIKHVGADAIDDLAFRLETFSAGGDYVGPAAAQAQEPGYHAAGSLTQSGDVAHFRTDHFSEGQSFGSVADRSQSAWLRN